MNVPPVMPLAPPPSTMVLGYLTSALTPTRARRTARIGLNVAGFCYVILAVLTLAEPVSAAIRQIARGTPVLWVLERWILRSPLPFLAIVLVMLAVLTFLAAFLLKRGKKAAGGFGTFCLLPLFFAFCVGAAFSAILPLTMRADARAETSVLGWVGGIFLALCCMFVALFTLDIVRCLSWVCKMPHEEMPPVPFVGQTVPMGIPESDLQ